MANSFFTIAGLIWLLVVPVSFLLGPLVGFDRGRTIAELNAFRLEPAKNRISKFLRMAVFWVAYFGFLFPATKPLAGFAIALVFLCIGAIL